MKDDRKCTDAQIASFAKYDAAHSTRIGVKFHNVYDADCLAWLDVQPSKMGAVKRLIRAEIARETGKDSTTNGEENA